MTTCRQRTKKGRALIPHGGDDKVMTPYEMSKAIALHFKPSGQVLEPCAGQGSFLRAMAGNIGISADWFEIDPTLKEKCKRATKAFGPRYMGNDFIQASNLLYPIPKKANPTFTGSGITKRYDWIVTNPPFSLFREFLACSMRIADNIVFLCSINAFYFERRVYDMEAFGFGIVEHAQMVQPGPPWPKSGVALAATWVRKGWTGSPHKHRLEY